MPDGGRNSKPSATRVTRAEAKQLAAQAFGSKETLTSPAIEESEDLSLAARSDLLDDKIQETSSFSLEKNSNAGMNARATPSSSSGESKALGGIQISKNDS